MHPRTKKGKFFSRLSEVFRKEFLLKWSKGEEKNLPGVVSGLSLQPALKKATSSSKKQRIRTEEIQERFCRNKKASYLCTPVKKTGGSNAERSLKVWKQ